MLYHPGGKPLPPSDIVRRLQQVDDRLDMTYVDGIPNPWAITMRWLLNDPRRKLIQQGQMNPGDDYDIVAYLPEDCPPEQAFGYLERSFVRSSGTKEEVRRLLERLHLFNRQVEKDNMKETNELAEELLETNAKTLFPGKEIPRTKAPKSNKNTDKKRLREYLMDR